MKINKRQLKRIIKEEVQKFLIESTMRKGTIVKLASTEIGQQARIGEDRWVVKDDEGNRFTVGSEKIYHEDDDKYDFAPGDNVTFSVRDDDDDESFYDRDPYEDDPDSPYYGGWGREGE